MYFNIKSLKARTQLTQKNRQIILFTVKNYQSNTFACGKNMLTSRIISSPEREIWEYSAAILIRFFKHKHVELLNYLYFVLFDNLLISFFVYTQQHLKILLCTLEKSNRHFRPNNWSLEILDKLIDNTQKNNN